MIISGKIIEINIQWVKIYYMENSEKVDGDLPNPAKTTTKSNDR